MVYIHYFYDYVLSKSQQSSFLITAYEPIEVKKKSINWNDYFGLDRRKKTGPGDGGRRFFKDHTHFLKRKDTQELNEEEDANDEVRPKV